MVRVRFKTCGELVEWIAKHRKHGRAVVSADLPDDRDIGFVCGDRHAVIRIQDVMVTARAAQEAIEGLYGEIPQEVRTVSPDRIGFSTPQGRHWIATGEVLPEKKES